MSVGKHDEVYCAQQWKGGVVGVHKGLYVVREGWGVRCGKVA